MNILSCLRGFIVALGIITYPVSYAITITTDIEEKHLYSSNPLDADFMAMPTPDINWTTTSYRQIWSKWDLIVNEKLVNGLISYDPATERLSWDYVAGPTAYEYNLEKYQLWERTSPSSGWTKLGSLTTDTDNYLSYHRVRVVVPRVKSPEPASVLLLMSGLAGIILSRKKQT